MGIYYIGDLIINTGQKLLKNLSRHQCCDHRHHPLLHDEEENYTVQPVRKC
jgi:hypothetical protein